MFLAALLFVPFARQLAKDKIELGNNPINEKFEILVGIINDALLAGRGEVTLFDDNPKLMNLFSKDQANILIQFFYGTGNLTITLNYKYYQRELVFKKEFYHFREAKETAEFMTCLYRNLVHFPMHKSFQLTVNEMKQKYPSNPENWNSFILLDAI